MRIPSEKKRPFVPRRARDTHSDPGQPIPRPVEVVDGGDYILVRCAGCKMQNVVHVDDDLKERPCVQCGQRLADAHLTKIAAIFDKVTGMRKRTRGRLGYRRALSKFELEIDPNLHLEGERLRAAMQEWLAENHTPWDLSNPRRVTGWLENPLGRTILLVMALAVLVGGIGIIQGVKSQHTEFEPAQPLPPLDPATELLSISGSEFEHAKPVARYFLEADSTTRLLSVVRDLDRVEPLIESFYANGAPEPVEFVDLQLVDAAEFGGRRFLRVAAELPDGQFAGLTLERGPAHYLVDWESFVGHSEVGWADFKSRAPFGNKPVRLRAYASVVTLPSPFRDEKKFQSIWLQSQDGEHLVGYIDRLAPKLIDLRAKIDEKGDNRYEVIVSVRYPEEQWAKDEVEILEIVQTGWVEWNRQPAQKDNPPGI